MGTETRKYAILDDGSAIISRHHTLEHAQKACKKLRQEHGHDYCGILTQDSYGYYTDASNDITEVIAAYLNKHGAMSGRDICNDCNVNPVDLDAAEYNGLIQACHPPTGGVATCPPTGGVATWYQLQIAEALR